MQAFSVQRLAQFAPSFHKSPPSSINWSSQPRQTARSLPIACFMTPDFRPVGCALVRAGWWPQPWWRRRPRDPSAHFFTNFTRRKNIVAPHPTDRTNVVLLGWRSRIPNRTHTDRTQTGTPQADITTVCCSHGLCHFSVAAVVSVAWGSQQCKP